MNRLTIIASGLVAAVLIGAVGFLVFEKRQPMVAVLSSGNAVGDAVVPPGGNKVDPVPITLSKQGTTVSVPLDRAGERVTKKPFGIYIDSATSPVQPERFRGYHTGTDYEIFPEEANADVVVRAVCSGTMAVRERASGYGGVVVERCTIGGSPVTVVYGHLALSSVRAAVGTSIGVGERLGILGAGYGADTDGERKHLHLGIHKGTVIDIRGYVTDKSALSGWIDPCTYFCK